MTAACPACMSAPAALKVAEAGQPNVVLSVPGLRCAACIQTVENTLNALPGVHSARVNLTLKRVVAQSDQPPEALIAALKRQGYAAYPFDLAQTRSVDDAVSKDLILRLGVAGFAMMNVMLLSVAIWSGASDATRDLFHLISAMIALPATIFAARPFFQKAWEAVGARRLNMDVPISLAIALAAGMSLYEALHGGAHAYFDAALSLTFFLLIGRVLEHHTRAAARSAAQDLAALEVQTARRRTGAGFKDVACADLKVGDTLQVATGMRVPVDGAVLQDGVLTDRAFLTGESAPVHSAKGEIVRAGEINVGAPFLMIASRVGEQTSLSQMARLIETAESARNSYTSLADRAARIYAPAVHLLALVTFVGWALGTSDLRQALNIAIAVLIITCPCALGLAVPAVATAAIGRLYAMGFLVKSGTALERLAETDTVLFDKTGTLTLPGVDVDLSALSDQDLRLAKALAQASQHPVSRALAQRLLDVEAMPLSDLTEHPGKGIDGYLGKRRVALGRADWLGGSGPGLTFQNGQTTLAIPITETLRPGAETLSPELRRHKLHSQILSGDTQTKTQALARRLGIADWEAGVLPERKHQVVAELQAKGRAVTMIGDGINDAAALAAAHASVAPGSALDAARNAADVILLRNSLEQLPLLFRIAKLSSRLSRQNFAIAALYNAIAIPIAVAGLATPMLAALAMSASSLTVLLNALRVRIAK